MKDRLFIRLTNDEKSLEWGLLTEENSVPSFVDRGELLLEDAIALAELAAVHPVILLLPSKRVRCFNINAPTKSRKQLEKAVPYLLEEQIIENVDTQHFALGSVSSDNKVAVNVVDSNYLQSLLEMFKAVEIEPDIVTADAACLPLFDDSWSLLDEGGLLLVKQSANEYWSAEPEMVAELLKWSLDAQIEEEQTISQAVRIYSCNNNNQALQGLAGFAIQHLDVDDSFLWLVSQFNNNGINLLQQDFTSQKQSNNNFSQWKISAIAAGFLVVSLVSYVASNVIILNKERSQLEQQLMGQLQQVFPNTTSISNGIYQLDTTFGQLGGSSASSNTFMLLMDKSFNVLSPTEFKFSQLEYLASRTEISFDVEATDYQKLTNAQNRLEGQGLKVEMRNASQDGNVWSTRFVIGMK